MTTIRQNWDIFSNELALPVNFFYNLLHHYSTSNRAYHNLNHINDCLNEFESTKHLAKNYLELKTAIWFHDIIYDTHSKNNEEESVELASKILKEEDISSDFINKVSNLILATKHIEIPKNIDAQLITDIDLSILGQPKEIFDRYEKVIRNEYSWVPEEEFKTKRAEILQGFLDRPSIYSTEFFRNKYESQAIKNLEKSIRNLK